MKEPNLYLTLIATLNGLLTCHAFPGWPGSGTMILGNALQFSQSTWETNLATPNATGNFSVSGFDISQPWPSQQVGGWMLSVNISSDIPDSEMINTNNATGHTFTGTSLFLTAPQKMRSSVLSSGSNVTDETTWKICVSVMTDGPQKDQSATDNGTCSYLSAHCVEDLQTAYADQFKRNQDCYASPSIPASCGNSVNQASISTIQFPIGSLGGKEILVTASDAHDAGNDSDYNSATKQIWPVLTVWGWNRRANASDDAQPAVQLSCIRANYVLPGSDSPSSSGSATQGSAVFALGIAGAASLVLL
ncbi:uncharacterized protein BCR38DRAFT_479451 [Pseudomassariella vexata]|uniref:Uncharacterized protein n=1 Tax=Pseudomassariella vexata TaxID=1141098 RepID=A0A1Y2EH71_9PEZI|nr:uncharacterized protein BCR38DRAFT_479451 [Pseudomassariella vexata]ORY70918.1 hypothetical protein BCR38DRAFT_479451 [Pseudomassariella vexata]